MQIVIGKVDLSDVLKLSHCDNSNICEQNTNGKWLPQFTRFQTQADPRKNRTPDIEPLEKLDTKDKKSDPIETWTPDIATLEKPDLK